MTARKPRKKATPENARTTPPPKSGRKVLKHSRVRQLELIIHADGRRVWSLRYRVRGEPQQRRIALGTFPALSHRDAGALAQEKALQAHEGRDPRDIEAEAAQAARVSETAAEVECKRRLFDTVLANFLEWVPGEYKTHKQYASQLNRFALPEFRGRDIFSITPNDVDRLRRRVAKKTPRQAEQLRSNLSTLFKYAAGDFEDLKNPARPPDKPTGGKGPDAQARRPKKRRRVLNDDELKALWAASGRLGYPWGSMARLLALTALRHGEVAGLTWDEIDLEARVIRLAAERTKANRELDLPLSDAAVELIKALPGKRAGFLFTTDSGKTHTCISSKKKADIDDLAEVEGWRVHDLRRTAKTRMIAAGVPSTWTRMVLNHSNARGDDLEQIYDQHDYKTEKRTAIETLEREILRVVEDRPPGNVTPISAARA